MKEKQLWLIFTVIILVAIAWFVWPSQRNFERALDQQEQDPSSQIDPVYNVNKEGVSLSSSYENGRHRLTGTITLPTPCYEVYSDVLIAESYPEQVRVDITTESQDGVCAQVITEHPIDIQYGASQDASLSLYINNQEVDVIYE